MGEDKHCSNQYYIDANINDHLKYLGTSHPPSSLPSPSLLFLLCGDSVDCTFSSIFPPFPPSLPLGVLFGAEELEGRLQEIYMLRGVEVNEGGRVAGLSPLLKKKEV